jgi:hypothetical protein
LTAWKTEVQKLSFPRTANYISSISIVTCDFKMPKFKGRSTGRGPQGERHPSKVHITGNFMREGAETLNAKVQFRLV